MGTVLQYSSMSTSDVCICWLVVRCFFSFFRREKKKSLHTHAQAGGERNKKKDDNVSKNNYKFAPAGI